MSKSLYVLLVFLFYSFTFCLFAGTVTAQPDSGEEWVRLSPHDFRDKKSCSVCHMTDSPELLSDSITTCTKCHRGNVGNHPVVRHPMGKAPGRMLPVTLPISEEGFLVCTTCHDTHNKSRNPNMLRVPSLKICATCHKGY